jgi:uncharacterized protein YqeY
VICQAGYLLAGIWLGHNDEALCSAFEKAKRKELRDQKEGSELETLMIYIPQLYIESRLLELSLTIRIRTKSS